MHKLFSSKAMRMNARRSRRFLSMSPARSAKFTAGRAKSAILSRFGRVIK